MRTTSAGGKGKGRLDPTLRALVPGWEFAQQELLVKNNYFQSLPPSAGSSTGNGAGSGLSPSVAVSAAKASSSATLKDSSSATLKAFSSATKAARSFSAAKKTSMCLLMTAKTPSVVSLRMR